MNIKNEVFLQTLFQINAKTNLTIDNLPSLSALVYQAAQLSPDRLLSKPQFVQIGIKFCGVHQSDALLLFDLYSALTGEAAARPRPFITFIFAVLFKATVSSKRNKILADELWPQQQYTFESLVEQFVRTCSDVLCASLCISTAQQSVLDIKTLSIDEEGLDGLRIIFEQVPTALAGQTALQVSAHIVQNAVCNNQTAAPTEQMLDKRLQLFNLSNNCVVYRFRNEKAATVTIYNCSHLVVYLLQPVDQIVVSACHSVKIYAPCCRGCVSINNSKTVNVSSVAAFCKVYHSDDLQLNVNCFNGCLQDSYAQTVTYAPFNLVYEHLEGELAANNMVQLLSLYQRMRIVGPLGLEWKEHVQPAGDFVTHVVPVGNAGSRKFIVQLPEEYRVMLDKRTERLKEFYAKLDRMNNEEKASFESEIKGQLMSWIQQNGLSGEMGWVCQAEPKDV